MKRIIGMFLLVLAVTLALQLQAQTQLPLDPNVRYGKLDNGLTYYIRSNKIPENRGEFYLVQKVGAMQEEDNQNGLAHFLEHMAFNSTKNFPTNVIDGLEKYGAKMGPNINAYTSTDETVYFLSGIPLTTPGAIDTCLLILHDWSSFITMKDEAIDKERLVITEEWRTSAGYWTRISDIQRPVIYKDSKYAKRDIIGDMDIIKNFPYQTLHEYYKKWYRPDLQAVIVVGDFNVDEMEAKIKTIMADLPKAVNPAERIYYPVPDNDKPLVVIATDPEATSTSIQLRYKQDVVPRELRNTYETLYLAHVKALLWRMIGERFSEIAQKPDAPFNGASGNYLPYTATKDAWSLSASSKEGRLEETFRIMVRENERVRRHGFTQGELDRAKAGALMGYETRYNNRGTASNGSIVSPLVEHFLLGQVPPGIDADYEMAKKILADINLSTVNDFFKTIITDKNIVISVSGPQKEGLSYPTEAKLLAIMAEVKAENIEPKVEAAVAASLMSELPRPGKVVKEEKDGLFGETIWTLSNGMRVIIKKTEFQNDQIIMSGEAFGGKSLIDDSEWLNMNFISAVPSIGGVGNLSPVDLRRFMSGKAAGVSISLGHYNANINGSSAGKDLETMLQLAHLYFTSPRKDVELFKAWLEQGRSALQNQDSNPDVLFSDAVNRAMYGSDNLRTKRMKAADLERVDYDRMIELYRLSFANPGAFTIIFTGTVDETTLRPLVERYLASLPSGNRDVMYKKIDLDIHKGKIKERLPQAMQTPKATVRIVYSGELPRNENTTLTTAVLNNVLSQLFNRTIREDEGGAYSIGSNYNVSRIPEGMTTLTVSYTTDPKRVDELNTIIYREINNLAENGPRDDEYQKAVEAAMKQRTEWQILNNFWTAVLNVYHVYGEDENTDFGERTRQITKEDLRDMMKALISQGNAIEVVMVPAE